LTTGTCSTTTTEGLRAPPSRSAIPLIRGLLIALGLADSGCAWLDSGFNQEMVDLFGDGVDYDPHRLLPEEGQFLIYEREPDTNVERVSVESDDMQVDDADDNDSDVDDEDAEMVDPTPNEMQLVNAAGLPANLAGVPVFRAGGEELVFIAHLLTRILPCTCRANRHFGLFKDKKFSPFRRTVDTTESRVPIHTSDAYDCYRAEYPLLRLKKDSAAITVEGLRKWHAAKMTVFVSREANKCKNKGCVQGKCTCPS